ncbi:sensor histidine kinase [Flagellimonas zhangzhouensis]|uniref:histidine kinase n=1 Tax=Flagellimonas zhangzhouensis TaxID=1073328 RepID=A0A1H2SUV0_9FLAO|nr:sensor histidine kinase [Allomuricauda zhangzhouensis]SDQ79802.1 Two-component sensor histidine kinase, contains HisKA and HATPase domains [Allomuricauda zhangzhouensis]SDW35446.1 Two-component sensor histidine kinase, contains HisKA and HATPase domains [Allomuricauda zhangzhouensis]
MGRYVRLLFTAIFFLFLCNASAQSILDDEQSVLKEFQDANMPANRFEVFFNSINRYNINSPYDWLDTIKIYRTNAEKTNDTNAIRLYLVMEAQLYNDLGEFDKSTAVARELYELKDTLDMESRNRVLNVLDNNYANLQLYDKQIEIRQEKRELGITDNVAFYDIYSNLGLYTEAWQQFAKEVRPTIADNDSYTLAKYHSKLGNFLRLDDSAPTALRELNKAKGYLNIYNNDISIQKSEDDIFEAELLEAKIDGGIAKCHVVMGELEEAIPLLEKSIEVLKASPHNNDQKEVVENTLFLAEANLKMDKNIAAKRILDTEFNNVSILQTIKKNSLLAIYYDKIENYQNATSYYKRNERIKDSLEAKQSNIIKQQLVTIVANEDLINKERLLDQKNRDMEMIMSDMKAKEERSNLVFVSLIFTLMGFAGLVYAYLKSIKNQRLIAEQKYIIENALIEKDSLLKEIHHRVKNNLQMVSSLLSLQTKNTRSKAAIEALEEGKSRVKAMALIHQKLYQNDDLSVIEMQGYIESLINSVQSVYKKGGHNISITIDAEGTELDIDRAIPFGLILNELVSNSFKYAFPENDENGKIYIHLRKNGDQGYFEYTDNGVGLPEDTDERSNSSMGIRLMNRLVNQLQSKLNIEKQTEGVRFWFNFS